MRSTRREMTKILKVRFEGGATLLCNPTERSRLTTSCSDRAGQLRGGQMGELGKINCLRRTASQPRVAELGR